MSTVKQNLSSDGNSTGSGSWLGGFLVIGVLLAVLGSLLIDWDYHIDVDPRVIGLHFLESGRWIWRWLTVGPFAAMGTAHDGNAGLRNRICGTSGIGVSCAAHRAFVAHSHTRGNRAGGWNACDCPALRVRAILRRQAETNPEQVGRVLRNRLPSCDVDDRTVLSGGVASQGNGGAFTLAFGISAAVCPHSASRRRSGQPSPSSIEDLRLIAAFLFTMLLFFQFGNEWAMAGWVPLFLIHTLGSSPEYAIFALVVYFAALTLARILAQRVAGKVGHRRLLIASILVAMSGYLLLGMAHSLADGYVGIVITALGFGPIYPLALKTLDDRFSYQARFYSRILSIAITGGLMIPWLLGYVDASFGMRPVMLVPAIGSVAVLALALLITLEARLMGGPGISVQSNLV